MASLTIITVSLLTDLKKKKSITSIMQVKTCSANSILCYSPIVFRSKSIPFGRKNTCNHMKAYSKFSFKPSDVAFGNYIRQHCYENNLEIFTFFLFYKKFCEHSPWVSREKACNRECHRVIIKRMLMMGKS